VKSREPAPEERGSGFALHQADLKQRSGVKMRDFRGVSPQSRPAICLHGI
jgi:hypothetical protein